MNIKEALNRVVNQLDLSTEEMQDVMREIMTGQCTDAQIGAFLMGMRMKSESIDEIVGAVSVMRELASHVHLQTLDHVVDVVGIRRGWRQSGQTRQSRGVGQKRQCRSA
jgi:anthranilate phosphoribosyltransferase